MRVTWVIDKNLDQHRYQLVTVANASQPRLSASTYRISCRLLFRNCHDEAVFVGLVLFPNEHIRHPGNYLSGDSYFWIRSCSLPTPNH